MKSSITLLLMIGAIISPAVFSEELSPRSYSHLPIDQNFIGLAYVHVDGDVYTSQDIPVEDLEVKVSGPLLAYVRTFELFGKSAMFDVITGQLCGDATALVSGEPASRSYCGLTDTKLRLNYNFYGAPALTLPEYVKHKKGVVIGGSLQVSAPTGEYQKDYILNIGSNRWYIKPEIGISIPHNNWEFDFSLGVKFFTDNNDLKRTSTFEQDPIFNAQMHIVYDIKPGQWIAFNSNYFGGGDTFLDGKKNSIKKDNFRAGFTYSMSVSRQDSIKFHYHQGVTTRLGNDSLGLALSWTHRWQ